MVMTGAYVANALSSQQDSGCSLHANLIHALWLPASLHACSDLSDADPSPQISASEAGSELPDDGSHRAGGARGKAP